MMTSRPKLLHLTTVDMTIGLLLLGQLKEYSRRGYEVHAMSAPGPWRERIQDAGIRFIPWNNSTRRWSVRSDLRAVRELWRVLRRERFDIVHTHNPKPGVLGRPTARLAKVPAVVNTVHGLYATPDDGLLRKLYLVPEWATARSSHFELFQSLEDLRWARRIGLTREERSAYLGNGVPTDRFDPAAVDVEASERFRRAARIPPGALVVAMVGRLVREKGWGEFIEAARRLRSRADRPEVVFVAIGPEDPEKPDAITRDTIGDSQVVNYGGFIEDMPSALALVDVFVLATYREGMPRSALEAAAMGKPLVLSDVRGCREVVIDGRNGFLVPVGRPDDLAAAIHRLLTDSVLRCRMGHESARLARLHFDESLVIDRTLRVYEALLDRRGRL